MKFLRFCARPAENLSLVHVNKDSQHPEKHKTGTLRKVTEDSRLCKAQTGQKTETSS